MSRKLDLLAKESPQAFMKVLDGIALETKKKVIDRQRAIYSSQRRSLEKGTRYLRKRNATTVKVYMNPKYHVLEHGAVIRPKKAKALHWINNYAEDVFAKKVLIRARPFFKPGVRDAIQANVIDMVAEQVYRKEAIKLGLL
jgi:hypothetical protein